MATFAAVRPCHGTACTARALAARLLQSDISAAASREMARSSGQYRPGSRTRAKGFTGHTGWGRRPVRKRPAVAMRVSERTIAVVLPNSAVPSSSLAAAPRETASSSASTSVVDAAALRAGVVIVPSLPASPAPAPARAAVRRRLIAKTPAPAPLVMHPPSPSSDSDVDPVVQNWPM